VQATLFVSGALTCAGNVYITGLPKASASNSNEYASCAVPQWTNFTLGNSWTHMGARIDPTATYIELLTNGTGQPTSNQQCSGAGTNPGIIVSCDYLY
jgi:hypothetical protein